MLWSMMSKLKGSREIKETKAKTFDPIVTAVDGTLRYLRERQPAEPSLGRTTSMWPLWWLCYLVGWLSHVVRDSDLSLTDELVGRPAAKTSSSRTPHL